MFNRVKNERLISFQLFVMVEFYLMNLLAGHSVVSRKEALERAMKLELDLVEVMFLLVSFYFLFKL